MDTALFVAVLLLVIAVLLLVVKVNILTGLVRSMREQLGQVWTWTGKDYSAEEPTATGEINSTNFAAGKKAPNWR